MLLVSGLSLAGGSVISDVIFTKTPCPSISDIKARGYGPVYRDGFYGQHGLWAAMNEFDLDTSHSWIFGTSHHWVFYMTLIEGDSAEDANRNIKAAFDTLEEAVVEGDSFYCRYKTQGYNPHYTPEAYAVMMY